MGVRGSFLAPRSFFYLIQEELQPIQIQKQPQMKPYTYNYWIKQNVVLNWHNHNDILDNTGRKRKR